MSASMLAAQTAEVSFSAPVTLLLMVVGGAIGGVIGRGKGLMWLGIVLGAVLGCIGWVIMLVIPTRE